MTGTITCRHIVIMINYLVVCDLGEIVRIIFRGFSQ